MSIISLVDVVEAQKKEIANLKEQLNLQKVPLNNLKIGDEVLIAMTISNVDLMTEEVELSPPSGSGTIWMEQNEIATLSCTESGYKQQLKELQGIIKQQRVELNNLKAGKHGQK